MSGTGKDLTDAFLDAARKGDSAAVADFLANGISLYAKAGDNWNAMKSAIHCGQLDMVKELRAQGFDVNYADGKHGETPLDVAIMFDRPEIAAWLLAQGARPKNSGRGCMNDSLTYAVGGNKPALVKILLDYGVDTQYIRADIAENRLDPCAKQANPFLIAQLAVIDRANDIAAIEAAPHGGITSSLGVRRPLRLKMAGGSP